MPVQGQDRGVPPASSQPVGNSSQGQSQRDAKVEQQPATLRVTTRLINVSVVVHDKRGNPVAGLMKDDFELLDNGQPQKIAFFSEVTNQPLRGKAIPLPENAFSNQVSLKTEAASSVTVILLDSLNWPTISYDISQPTFMGQGYARAQLVPLLKELRPQDRVAIYTMGRTLRILHDFSNDPASLLRALKNYQGERAPEFEPVPPPVPEDVLLLRAHLRADQTKHSFQAIAEHLRDIQGRKSLIWMTTSFPITGTGEMDPQYESYDSQLESAAKIFDDAGVTVYPVDVRGLTDYVPDSRTLATMKYLADRTGGRAFYNTNDLTTATRAAMDDSTDSYMISFYSDHGKWNGEFHDLKVKTKPELKGFDVRARRGYFANWDTPLNHKQREAKIEEAIGSPLDSSGIGIQVYVDEPTKPGSRYRFLQLFLDAHQIHLDQTKGRWNGSFDLVQVQRSPDGKVLAATDQTMKMRLTPSTYDQVMLDGYHFSQQIKLAPGATDLRIIIRDTSTSALGSLTVPLVSEKSRTEPE